MKNLILTTLLWLVFAIASLAQLPPYVPTGGLVSWYSFIGNANDLSGNGNNGIVNGATLVPDRLDNPNSAYSFNGTNNYIEIADAPKLQFNANLQTISFWFKIPQIPAPIYLQAIIDKYNQHLEIESLGNAGSGFLVHFASNGNIFYSFKNGIGHNWGDCSISSSQFSPNQYYHIVFTNDSDSLRGFVNGKKVSASKIPAGTVIGANNFSLLLGKERLTSGGNSMDFFNGIIDDLGIWDRAFTPDEIDHLYNSTKGYVGINISNPARNLHIKDVLRLEPRSTAPNNPSEGDIYYDSIIHKLRVYDGTTWQNCW